MVEIRNGVRGKVCSTCRNWKPLADFPTDPSHPSSQGGRHCRCKECHRNTASKRRAVMRQIKAAVGTVVAVFLLMVDPAFSKDKATYETGKLIDVDVRNVTRGTAIVGGMAAPIPGRLYLFQIQSQDLTYFAEYQAGKLSYKPDWVVNDPIAFRLAKDNRMFLKRPDGKELEVVVVKKVRQ
jgi:hypothetical protein